MNKQNGTMTKRRLFALLSVVGVTLGLGVSAFLASINGADKSLVADAPRQTIEVKTPNQVTTATPSPTADAISPAPTKDSDGATAKVSNPTTVKVNQTVVDSSTRVTVKPKPVATPPRGTATQPTPEAVTPAAPQKKSPTEGFIRPQVSFLGATSCKAISDGWRVTISWKVSGGNFIGRFNGQNSGLKSVGDSWTISSDHEIGSTDAPEGSQIFRTEGDFIWFMAMNGDNQVIDEYWFADSTTANVTGLCR